MKKILKSKIFIVIITTIMVASGTLYAANIYYANEVKYTPSDSSWNVTNVNDALNNLYSMKTELDTIKGIGDATAGDIASGKTAVVKGEKVMGTKVDGTNYKVYRFYSEATVSGDHATYKDNAWVPITYVKNYDCSDGTCFQDGGVYFTIDLGFTPKKVVNGKVCLKAISTTTEMTYTTRITAGYNINSSTATFWYMEGICADLHYDYVDSTTGENNGINVYKSFHTKNNELIFDTYLSREDKANGDTVAGTWKSPYQVYGTLFYLSGTIIYEE